MKRLVAGAGGFIGGWLVGDLLQQGHSVRAVDLKPPEQWWQLYAEADNLIMDLREYAACNAVVRDVSHVYNLAADMGGIGYITTHRIEPMRSVLINTHLIEAAQTHDVERYFFASSACIYGEGLDTAEVNAYPAQCEDGYGWEKLFSERMCRHYLEERGLATRVARLHNTYGPHGSYDDGREKAPSAIARKIAVAKRDGADLIDIWGNGLQRRTFTHISDCLRGIRLVTEGEHPDPVNLGSAELVTINQLTSIVEEIADYEPARRYRHDAAVGVEGRTSDNVLFRDLYGWEPALPLADGMVDTYEWIEAEVTRGR